MVVHILSQTQSAGGSSQLQLLTNLPRFRWCEFSQRFSVLVAKIPPYPIQRQRCTIFCLYSVNFGSKKLFSTYQAEQTDLEGKNIFQLQLPKNDTLLFRMAHK